MLIAAAAVVLFPSLAGAHHNTITGLSACADASGTYTVTWSIQNSQADTAENATLTFTGGGTLSSSTVFIDKGATVQVTQSGIPGTATTATLTANALWTNNTPSTNTGSVTLGGTCTITATPVKPSVTQAECTAPGQATTPTFTVPTTTGVNYQVGGQTVTGTQNLPQGTSVVVTAVAQPGYTLTGDTSWTLTADPINCTVTATPAAPTIKQASCLGTPGDATVPSYTIPTTPGVNYLVNGNVVTAGAYDLAQDQTVVITAQAKPGYVLAGTATWTLKADTIDCTEDIEPAAPAISQAECVAPGQAKDASYTIPTTTGVVYWVNDSDTPTAAGTYPLAQGATVEIRATAIIGYTIEGDAEWTLTADEIDCTVTATPATPTYTVQACLYPSYTVQPATVTIPSTTGVVYSLDGQTTPAGTVTVGTGTHIVTAVGVDGYELIGYPEGGWSTTIAAVPCEFNVLASPPTPPSLASTGADAFDLLVIGSIVLLVGAGMVGLTHGRRDSSA